MTGFHTEVRPGSLSLSLCHATLELDYGRIGI